MSWFIETNVNEGYPYNTDFPDDYQEGFNPLPALMWRIRSGINEGYPWIGYWYPDEDDTGEGEIIHTGGRQTNFPNGLSNGTTSNLNFDPHTNNMKGGFGNGGGELEFLSTTMTSFVCTKYDYMDLRERLTEILSAAADDWDMSILQKKTTKQLIAIQRYLGKDIHEALPVVKYYNFNIPVLSLEYYHPLLFGMLDLCISQEDGDLDTVTPHLYQAKPFIYQDFGEINLNFTEGWEFKNIEWEIYLPYAGLHSINLKCNEPIQLTATISLPTGAIQYYLFQRENLIFTTNGYCGIDIPLNTSAANEAISKQGWRNNLLNNTLIPLVNTIGSSLGPDATAGLEIASLVSKGLAGNGTTLISNNSLYSIGGLNGLLENQEAYIIAKVPIIHNNAYGYPEIMGMNVSKAFERLGDCSGFIKTENFKCEVIVATTDEKLEIERLLNAGVFV